MDMSMWIPRGIINKASISSWGLLSETGTYDQALCLIVPYLKERTLSYKGVTPSLTRTVSPSFLTQQDWRSQVLIWIILTRIWHLFLISVA